MNFAREKALYVARLKKRLADGSMSQQTFDDKMAEVQNSLDNVGTETYKAFREELTKQLTELPNKIGSAVGGAANGFSSGLFSSLGLSGWAMTAGLIVGAWWLFAKGPLKK